ncbi:ATP-binding cassette domain-containing protein [Micromonospora globosa]|uniref:ATP-binding cassette domain-containing protein n=1 Tax=Micromonospora globosa TaxID=47863 RepID=UPI0012F9E715|nr:hypothetical protein [Micromonospora globosa]
MKVWAKSIQLFHNKSYDLPAPGVTAIVGGNNSGKSTLLRQLNDKLHSPGNLLYGPVDIVTNATSVRTGTAADFLSWFAQHATYFPGGDRQESYFRQPNGGWSSTARALASTPAGDVDLG